MNRVTRREALSSIAAAGFAGAQTTRPLSARPKKVIIAGGGIAGLCCGYELMKRGHEVTVLEAAGRAGGHVRTIRDGYADGLYVDAGAEHFTKPGYDLYWGYVKEFNLPYVEDHRRKHMMRWMGDRMYSEEQLADPQVLAGMGFNQTEIDYLRRNPWWDLPSLYFARYDSAFRNEYDPFSAGLNDLDHMTVKQLLEKDGASPAAVQRLGGSSSALHQVWHHAILKARGVPVFPTQIFRLAGGNSLLPETFARHLGERVRLGAPVTAIRHSGAGVTVSYKEFGKPAEVSADYLVCCMSAVMLRQIPITPELPEGKRWAIQNMPYYSATRPVLQARTKFWREEKVSPNIQFNSGALEHVWSQAEDVKTERGLIVGTAQPGVKPDQALAVWRSRYPGKLDQIEAVSIIDWSQDPWAQACETTAYRPGELAKFWPAAMEPAQRIHFAGAYCDNLNWGQEAATRSANRVAAAIDRA